MTERSLSAIYQAGLRLRAGGVDVEDLAGLSGATTGDIDPQVLERLAATPDAHAVHSIARSLSSWSTGLADEVRRARSNVAGGATRTRALGWISLAAAAGLALFVVGIGQRGSFDAPSAAAQAASGPAPSMTDDILFVEPDRAVAATSIAPSSDSIFTDNLDG